jgi:hypothetical protein
VRLKNRREHESIQNSDLQDLNKRKKKKKKKTRNERRKTGLHHAEAKRNVKQKETG